MRARPLSFVVFLGLAGRLCAFEPGTPLVTAGLGKRLAPVGPLALYSGYAPPAWRQGARLADPVSQTLRPRTLSLRPRVSGLETRVSDSAPPSLSLRPRVSGLEIRISDLAPPYLRVGVPVSRVSRPVSLTLRRLAHAWRAVSRIWIDLLMAGSSSCSFAAPEDR